MAMMWLEEVDLSPSLAIRCKMGVSLPLSAHKCSACISVIIFLFCTSSITSSVKKYSASDRAPCRTVFLALVHYLVRPVRSSTERFKGDNEEVV